MENKALGICKSNGNVLNSALQVICACLTEADTEAEQTHGGGLSIAGGLAQLSTQRKAVCVCVCFQAAFFFFVLTSLSVLLGFDKKSKNPATLVSSSSSTPFSFSSS